MSNQYIYAYDSPLVFNIGVGFDWRAANLQAMVNIIQGAEELGFESAWVPEAWGLESFSCISHILTLTRRIRIGAGIINVFSRSATLIGMGCATLNQIAPERFILGLGVSGRGLIERWHGVEFRDPIIRVLEYLEVISKTVSGEKVDYSGKHLKLSGFRLFTQPLTEKLTVYLAALGDKSLTLAGKHFDGAILTMYPSSKLDHAVRLVTTFNPNKKIIYFQPVVLDLSGNTPADKTWVARTIVFYVASMGDYYHRNLSVLGFKSTVEEIRSQYVEGNKDEALKAAEPLVEELALTGSPQKVAEKLLGYPSQVTPVLVFKAENQDNVVVALKTMKALREAFEGEK
ncbi:MAG: LLM class flavin-dependent oxidoreductase [Thermoprotei archaeon]